MAFNKEQLLAELAHFTGTIQWFKNPLFPSYKYTEGVKHLAEKTESYWLIDYILSNQSISEIKSTEFQVWKINVIDTRATIQVEDGNYGIVKEFTIPFTDFPFPEFKLWFVNKTLLLPSEY